MTFVASSSILPRRLWRPALFFFAVAQMLLAFAPLTEGRWSGSQAHVEEAGTSLHHAHNESGCAACVARGLLASSAVEARRISETPSIAFGVPDFRSLVVSSTTVLHSRSRAPPSILA
jgi:hypothetical protein